MTHILKRHVRTRMRIYWIYLCALYVWCVLLSEEVTILSAAFSTYHQPSSQVSVFPSTITTTELIARIITSLYGTRRS